MTYLRLISQALPKSTPKSNLSSIFLYTLHLICHVKPNSKSHHYGCITLIRPDKIDVSVPAAPRDGDANRAVTRVLAEVHPLHSYTSYVFVLSKVLNDPRPDVEVIHRGGKSREKVFRVRDWVGVGAGRENEGEALRAVQEILERACAK